MRFIRQHVTLLFIAAILAAMFGLLAWAATDRLAVENRLTSGEEWRRYRGKQLDRIEKNVDAIRKGCEP
jgi:hypothetical protein